VSGIAVIYDPLDKKEEVEGLVPRMCKALKRSDREGPVEWYSGPGFGMGRCRPALVNQVSQPAWNEDRTVCAFFHGELFGHQDLQRSMKREGHQCSGDSHAEFVVHLYEDRGDAFVHALNGSFAVAVWDSRQQRLIIANDRYGLCPLYTAQSGGKYLWASAPKGILADATFPRQINLAAMADFLCRSIPQGNETMFDGIEELPSASVVICHQGQVRCQQYWDLSLQEEETGISAGDYLDGLVPLLRQVAERWQAGDLRVGLLLSGGLDSRIALSVLRKDAVTAFTFGTPGCPDVRYARQVAKVGNVSHLALEIKPDYLEDFAWTGIRRTEDLLRCDRFHSIGVYDEIASHVDALITGSTADWILGRFVNDPRDPFWSDGFSVDRYYDSRCLMTDEELERLVKPVYFRQMKGLARSRLHRDFEKCSSRHTTNKVDYWYIRQSHRRLWNRLASLFPDNLVFRPLFFDNDLVDFAQTIPPSLRWGDNSVYRQIIFRTAPELAQVPSTTTAGLPLNANHRQMAQCDARRKRLERWRNQVNKFSLGLVPPMKTGFYADYDRWLRRELRDWAESILLDPRTLSREYWNPSAIVQLMEEHARHDMRAMRALVRKLSPPGDNRQGTTKLAKKLTTLISFELWHRMYLDEPGRIV
jgi:asparagine synthase (glutamine-hydrolysing)